MHMESPRIAAVDDDPMWLSLLGRALAREGLHASLIGDADRAVDQIVREKPNVVVLDYGLPRTNGARLAREIHERLGDDCPAMCLITGDLRGVSEEDRAVFDAALEKPVPLGVLLHTLRTLIRKRPASGMRMRAVLPEEDSSWTKVR